MKRKKCTSVVLRQQKWAYIYEIVDTNDRPIYIGRTINETQRAAAHQRTATSQCKRLGRAIAHMKMHSSTWEFSKSYRRVRGLEHGLPEEKAEKFEAYFIYTLNTLHSSANPNGCNMREGDNVVQHETDFPEITKRIEELGDGESLFSEQDRRKRLLGVSPEMLESAAELHIVSNFRKACTDEDGGCPECVEAVYALVETKHGVVSNIYETRSALKRLKLQYSKMVRDDQVDRQMFASDMNNLKSLLIDFLPNEENAHQNLGQKLSLGILKIVSHFIANGENIDAKPVTAAMAIETVKLIENAVGHRDAADGLPGQSFQSRLAWCKPNSSLKGDLQDNLKRTDALLQGPLTEEQREKAVQRRSEVLAAMAERKPL